MYPTVISGLIQCVPCCNTSFLLFWPYPAPTLSIMWFFSMLHQKADKEKDTDSAPRKILAWIQVKTKEYDVHNWSRNITLVIFQRLFGRSTFAGQILNVFSKLPHFTTRIHYPPLMCTSFCKVNCTALQIPSLFCCPSGTHHYWYSHLTPCFMFIISPERMQTFFSS